MGERIQSRRTIPVDRGANAVPVIARAPYDLQTYTWITPVQAAGASNKVLAVFNAANSGVVVRVRSVLAIPRGDTAATTTVRVRFDLALISAVATGGTAWNAPTTTIDAAGGSVVPMDSANDALPAEVTGRHIYTGGATISAWLSTSYLDTEESEGGVREIECLPRRGHAQDLTLREGEGFRVEQGSVAGAGGYHFQVVFTVE